MRRHRMTDYDGEFTLAGLHKQTEEGRRQSARQMRAEHRRRRWMAAGPECRPLAVDQCRVSP